jgi:hypothetical protein
MKFPEHFSRLLGAGRYILTMLAALHAHAHLTRTFYCCMCGVLAGLQALPRPSASITHWHTSLTTAEIGRRWLGDSYWVREANCVTVIAPMLPGSLRSHLTTSNTNRRCHISNRAQHAWRLPQCASL